MILSRILTMAAVFMVATALPLAGQTDEEERPVFEFRSRTPKDWSSVGYGIRMENIVGRVALFSEGHTSDWADDLLVGLEGPLFVVPINWGTDLGIAWHLRARFLNPDREAMHFVTPRGLFPGRNQTEFVGMIGLDTNAGIRNQRQRVVGQWADRAFIRIGWSFSLRTVDNMPSQKGAFNSFLGEGLWIKNIPGPTWLVRPVFPGQRQLDVAYLEVGGFFNHPIRHYPRSGRELDRGSGVIFQTYPDHGLTAYGAQAKGLLKFDARWLDEEAPALILNSGIRFAYEAQEVRRQDLPPNRRGINNDIWTQAWVVSLTYIFPGGDAALTGEYQRVNIIGGDREFFFAGQAGPNTDIRARRPDAFNMFRIYLRTIGIGF
jgi:hypothetical protein